MSVKLALIVIINLSALLLASWLFFLVIIARMKNAASNQVGGQSVATSKDSIAQENPEESQEEIDALNQALKENAELTKLIDQLAKGQKEQATAAGKLRDLGGELDQDNKYVQQLMAQIRFLENQCRVNSNTIDQLQQQQALYRERYREQRDLVHETDQSDKVNSLLSKVSRLRFEKGAIEQELERYKRKDSMFSKYRGENSQLRMQVDEFFDQIKEQEKLIERLKRKLRTAQETAKEAQQALAVSMQNEGKQDESAQEAIARAERERKFIEEQYLSVLQQLEEAEKISEELERSQKECAQLEQAYMELIKEIDELESEGAKSTATTKAPEPAIVADIEPEDAAALHEQWQASMNK